MLKDLEGIKASNQQVLNELGEIKGLSRQNLDTAQKTLRRVEEMSRRQRTGETGSIGEPRGQLSSSAISPSKAANVRARSRA